MSKTISGIVSKDGTTYILKDPNTYVKTEIDTLLNNLKEEFETKITNSVSINYGTKEEFESKKDSLPDGTVFITTDE